MRKIILPFALLLFVFFIFFTIYNFHYKKFNLATKKMLNTNFALVNTNNKNETTEQATQINNILGNSNKLTANQWRDMLNWRNEIYILAQANPNQIYLNGTTNEKKVSLTFDDGPDGFITPQIIDILQQNKVKGNFFFIGNRLDRYRSVVKKAYDNGNLVLNHTWSHANLSKVSSEQVKLELLKTENKLFEITGKKPALVRPPYGDINEKVTFEIKNNGSKSVLWSIDTLDWSQKEKDNIVKNIVNNVRPGDIILMHSNEDKIEDVRALPIIIDELQKKGYKFVDLSEILGINPYK